MTKMLTAAEMRAEVDSCKRALDDLAREYAVAEERAYTSQSTDQAHVASGPSNVPYALADAHRKLRGELRYASEFIRLVLHGRPKPDRFFGVLDQVDILRARLEMDEQRHGEPWDEAKGAKAKDRVSRAEVEESVAAQAERRTDGDHDSGDQAIVRDKLGLRTLDEEFRYGVR
jgi:hypothetical protein